VYHYERIDFLAFSSIYHFCLRTFPLVTPSVWSFLIPSFTWFSYVIFSERHSQTTYKTCLSNLPPRPFGPFPSQHLLLILHYIIHCLPVCFLVLLLECNRLFLLPNSSLILVRLLWVQRGPNFGHALRSPLLTRILLSQFSQNPPPLTWNQIAYPSHLPGSIWLPAFSKNLTRSV
jgi:hypothetical protein